MSNDFDGPGFRLPNPTTVPTMPTTKPPRPATTDRFPVRTAFTYVVMLIDDEGAGMPDKSFSSEKDAQDYIDTFIEQREMTEVVAVPYYAGIYTDADFKADQRRQLLDRARRHFTEDELVTLGLQA